MNMAVMYELRRKIAMLSRRWIAILVIIYVTLLNASISVGDDDVSGYLTPKIHGDTLVIDYHLIVEDMECDSIVFQLTPDSSQLEGQSTWHLLTKIKEGKKKPWYIPEWKGQLRLPGYHQGVPKKYRLRLYETPPHSRSSDSGYIQDNLVFYPTGTFGRRADMGIAMSTKSGFPEPVHSTADCLVLRLEDRWGYYHRYFALFAGYSINYSKRFSLYDYGRLEGEIIPWGRDRWLPIFHAATSYSSVKGYEKPYKFVKKGFGVEAGIRFDGPIESIRYSYNTTAGGYHRGDLIFAFLSYFGDKKIGAMYSIYQGKYVRMIALSIFMEGWGGSGNETLRY